MPNARPIDWANARTLTAVAILVGTEFVGAAWAAGWALGGLFGLGPTFSHVMEGAGVLAGLLLLLVFMRTALRFEPLRP